MGRPIPSSQPNSNSTSALSLPLLAASIVASITVFVTLCVSHHRKVSTPKQLTSSDKSVKKIKKLPPQQQHPIEDDQEPPTTSQRRLSWSLSMRLTEGLMSKICTMTTTTTNKKVEEEEEEVESVWKKTIILGERCKVPIDDEDDEFVIGDGRGDRQRNYRPRMTRSLPVTRTNSFAAAS